MHKSRLLLTLAALNLIVSCKTKAPVQKIVVTQPAIVEIGDEKFSPEDFQDSYMKNRFAGDSSKGLTPQEYLPLYTDMKMKVKEARQQGKDTTTDYREEIASYKSQLAKNFLVDKPLVEKFANEAYNRLKQEVRASHILVSVSEDASPEDSLQAYRAAVALRGRVDEGSDFGDLASKFSKDPTATTNKGDLGYLTAFQTLYNFENALYTLPVGKVSQPVRTRAGYHLIKVTDRRPSRGIVRVAHIMTRVTPEATDAQKQAAKVKVEKAYADLQAGETWNAVAEAYSEDRESAKNQGLLPPFGIGQMVQEIETTAFDLTKPGSYSKPVLSPYGWHIIKLIERKNLEPYTTMAPSLRQKVVTDSRGKVIELASSKRLREKFPVKEEPAQWSSVASLADSSLIRGKWDYARAVSANWSEINLFQIGNQSYSALEFLNYVKRKQSPRPSDSSPAVIFKRYYTDFQNDRLSSYEKDHLEENSPEFRGVISEIREGVLLSQLMEEQVWQKSLADSSGQLRFYQQNTAKYQYPERAYGLLIMAPDTQTINKINRTLAKTPYLLERKGKELLFEENKDDLNATQQTELRELVAILQKNPDYLVEIAGYRSPQESESVSANRIRNVVKILNTNNISIVRIIEKDYGSFRQGSEAARNRRVGFQFFSSSKKDVEKLYNSAEAATVTIDEGFFTKNHAVLSKAKWEAGKQTVTLGDKVAYIHVQRLEAPRAKTFSEARGSVVNDYQKELEKQLLSKLHEKFPVKVNTEELDKIKR